MKAVVFDIGATLVDGPPVAPAKVIASLTGAGYRDVAGIIMRRDFADSDALIRALEEELSLSFSPVAREKTKDLWESQFTGCHEINDSSNVLRFFARRHIRIGLLSDIWRPYYEGVKRAVKDIESLAEAKALSFCTGHKKPDPYNFRLITELLSLEPQEILMVGDTYSHDIEPAIALGMKTAWLLRRPEKEADDVIDVINGKKPAPDLTIKDLAGLCGAFPQEEKDK
ncbi:MAG: HAD family hydrolase [Abditibacteriota bacterium]|nr:HAD family hydrolase [Abditibacteriota bacterium]